MMRTPTHAPEGGSIPGALCEEPTGDVSTHESDVDCPECLDELAQSGNTFKQLAHHLEELRSQPRRRPGHTW